MLAVFRNEYHANLAVFTLSSLLWPAFILLMRLKKQPLGYSHAYLTALYLCALPTTISSNMLYKIFSEFLEVIGKINEAKSREDAEEVDRLVAIRQSLYFQYKPSRSAARTTTMISQLVKVSLLWLIVMRFRRVEVQVVQGAYETTFSIF